jgi:hypothetical protein
MQAKASSSKSLVKLKSSVYPWEIEMVHYIRLIARFNSLIDINLMSAIYSNLRLSS